MPVSCRSLVAIAAITTAIYSANAYALIISVLVELHRWLLLTVPLKHCAGDDNFRVCINSRSVLLMCIGIESKELSLTPCAASFSEASLEERKSRS